MNQWSDAADLVGEYFSEELQTTYRIVMENNRLILKHLQNEDVLLQRLDKDNYIGDAWWFSKVKILRNDQNNVTGFRLNADEDRIQNLMFIKK